MIKRLPGTGSLFKAILIGPLRYLHTWVEAVSGGISATAQKWPLRSYADIPIINLSLPQNQPGHGGTAMGAFHLIDSKGPKPVLKSVEWPLAESIENEGRAA